MGGVDSFSSLLIGRHPWAACFCRVVPRQIHRLGILWTQVTDTLAAQACGGLSEHGTCWPEAQGRAECRQVFGAPGTGHGPLSAAVLAALTTEP